MREASVRQRAAPEPHHEVEECREQQKRSYSSHNVPGMFWPSHRSRLGRSHPLPAQRRDKGGSAGSILAIFVAKFRDHLLFFAACETDVSDDEDREHYQHDQGGPLEKEPPPAPLFSAIKLRRATSSNWQ